MWIVKGRTLGHFQEKLVNLHVKFTKLPSYVIRLRNVVSLLGWRTSIKYGVFKIWGSSISGEHTLHPRQTVYPLLLRPNSSDVNVFSQVFVETEYAPLNHLTEVRLIIDLGANIGLSSAYFLNMFPDASVIAVEPDPANFALLKRNMKPYGSRVKAIHAGIWSHPARLTINDAPYRDGRAWTKQVVECDAITKDYIHGVDIPTLLKCSGHDEISLLKIDIEGAEAVIFATNYSWITRVGAIAIELHDDLFSETLLRFFSPRSAT